MSNDPRRRQRPQRQQASDIDRFLAEVDRLRRKAANEAKGDAPLQMEELVEVQEVLPAQPPPPPRRPAYEELVDEVVVVPEPPSRRYSTSPPPPVQRPPAGPAPAAPAKKQVIAPVRRAAVSPTAKILVNMLRSPQNVRAAILVHEILDAPLCRRRR